MAIALVQKTLSQTTTLGVNTATLVGTAAGNMLVVAITYYGGGSDYFSSIAGTADSYSQIGPTRSGNATSDYLRLYYAKNIIGGTEAVAVTFSGSPGSGDTMVAVYEYSGADTTAPLDSANPGATGTGTATSPGAVTPTVNNCLIFSVGVDDGGANNNTPTANTGQGFVLQNHQDDSSSHERIYTEDVIQTTATSATGSFTAGGGGWAAQVGVFKPAAAIASTGKKIYMTTNTSFFGS